MEEINNFVKRELDVIPEQKKGKFLAVMDNIQKDKKKIHILERAFRYNLTDREIERLIARRTADEMLQLLYGISWNKQVIQSIRIHTEESREERMKNANRNAININAAARIYNCIS